MLGQGAQAPSTEVQRFVQSALSMANFFKSILCQGGELDRFLFEFKFEFEFSLF